MKNIIVLFSLLISLTASYSQNCFPFGLYINSQEQIDSFAIDFPNCTIIDGDLTIEGIVDWAITDLEGLTQIERINGKLRITDNISLESLSGLENLKYILSDCDIDFCISLKNLNGLSQLDSIGGSLFISSNWALESLNGLIELKVIKGGINITDNGLLTDLHGLERISSLEYQLGIWYNDGLVDLSGIEGLETIGGDLQINENRNLKGLKGIENLKTIGGNVNILRNTVLEYLSESDDFGLGALESIGGELWIYRNDALMSIDGLKRIQAIPYGLIIEENNSLIDISDLRGVESVGYLDIVGNPVLNNLSGLHNLTEVGGRMNISNNENLNSISQLKNLRSIGSYLVIDNNDALASLDGLENIDPTSIKDTDPNQFHYDLSIRYNPRLSECEVSSICDFLQIENRDVAINDNRMGCESESEILSACTVSVSDQEAIALEIFPNPVSSILFFRSEKEMDIDLFNGMGQHVLHSKVYVGMNELDVSMFSPGLYTIKTKDGYAKIILTH
jgi:hypothetical protein